MYIRLIQGDFGDYLDRALFNLTTLPIGYVACLYLAAYAVNEDTIKESGLIPGRGSNSKGRLAVFFLLVKKLRIDQHPETGQNPIQEE